MNLNRWKIMVGWAAALALAPAAWAQFNPKIAYVYPAGGRQGTTFEVLVAGQFIQGVTNVFISGSGARAELVEFNQPMNNRDFQLALDKIKEMNERLQASYRSRWNPASSSTNAVWTAADDRELADIRERVRKNPPNFNNRISAALAQVATVRVTLAPDAPPGEREIRLGVPQGVTNPLVFCVSKIQEFNETEEFRSFDPRFPFAGPQQRFGQPSGPKPPDQRVTLPAVINGRLMPGDVDRFCFAAAKGQRLVVIASARQLIPYISDAVPGWFQATLALYDAKGREVAYDDDFRFNPDPVLFYQIPADGDYTVEIKDSIFRGREDFVYRITLGELPFVTGVFPLGGPAGEETVVEKRGVNLRETAMTVDNRNRTPGIYLLPAMVANPVPFAVDSLPECLEKEPNDDKTSAQRVTTPIIVNGRIGAAGETDVFRIEGKEGEEFVAEVVARRLNSPLDSVLKLTDATGKEIAFNDDHADKGAGLTTHHADSYIRATFPKTGVYYLHLSDTQQHGGPEYAYRLRLGPPQPDFELRIVPSSINTRVAATTPFTVYALRKDGFDGDITLSLRDAPEGFRLGGARLPAGQDKIRLTLTVPPTPRQEPLPLQIEGRATVAGRERVHRAVPAEDMMQAFEYRHLVPAKELKVFVAGNMQGRAPYVRILNEPPLKIPAGGAAKLQIFAPGFSYIPKAQIELSDPPEGITVKRVTLTREGREIELAADAKAKLGLKGNLIVSFSGEPNFPFGKGNAPPPPQQQRPRRFPFATLPAIPFEVVQK